MTISCLYGEHQETLKLTKRATYINNGINTDDIDKMLEKVKSVEHPFIVFTLGRICYQKNPVLFNTIAEEMPDITFLWIGDGELKSELKSPNIVITGWVDRTEALRLSVNADIFLLTSLWEGLPISLLESMYMKKPCVVSDVIGNHDVIHNGKNGLVCRSVDEFKKAILSDSTSVLTTAAYEEVINDYNTVTMASKYSSIYTKVISL